MCIHHLNKGKLTERFKLKVYNICLSVSDGFFVVVVAAAAACGGFYTDSPVHACWIILPLATPLNRWWTAISYSAK